MDMTTVQIPKNLLTEIRTYVREIMGIETLSHWEAIRVVFDHAKKSGGQNVDK